MSLTLTWIGLPTGAVGRPPGMIVVKWGALLTVLPCCVVSTLAPARHLEDTSGHAQSLPLHQQMLQTCDNHKAAKIYPARCKSI